MYEKMEFDVVGSNPIYLIYMSEVAQLVED